MDSYIAPCSSLLSHHSRPHIKNHQPKSSMCVPIFCLVLQSQQLLESCRLVSSSSHYQQHLSFFDTGENDTHHIHSLLLFIAAGSLSSSLSAVSAFLVFLVYRRPVVVVLTFFATFVSPSALSTPQLHCWRTWFARRCPSGRFTMNEVLISKRQGERSDLL